MKDERTWEARARAELQCLADDIADQERREANKGGQQVGTQRKGWLSSVSAVREISAMLQRLGVEGRP